MASDTVRRTFQMWRSMLPERPDVTIEEFRAGYDRMFTEFPVDPAADIVEIDAGGVRSLVVTVGPAQPQRWVVYFHGGGYMCGNPEGVRGTAALLARALDGAVLVPDYRLAPEHAHPAAVDDAVASVRWLLDDRGVDPARIALLGDSAGGGIVVAATRRLLDAGVGPLAAVAGWSPWVDLEVTGSTIQTKADVDPIASGQSLTMSAQAYLQGQDVQAASPLEADLTGFPPLLIHVGGEEVLLDDSLRLAARAEAAGVEVEIEVADGLPHVYQYFASFLAEGRASIERTGEFVRKRTP